MEQVDVEKCAVVEVTRKSWLKQLLDAGVNFNGVVSSNAMSAPGSTRSMNANRTACFS